MKVLVADGHPATRLGLKGLFINTEFFVVGETYDGEEVVQLILRNEPDLVILGLNLMGELDPVACCQRIKVMPDPPWVLIYTAYNLTDDVASCLLAGADSYVHKRCRCEELLDAARRTVQGERIWRVGGRIGDPRSRLDTTSQGVRLTGREREVLSLMVRGHTNPQIACGLRLGLPTIRTHVRNILRKLGAKSRRDLFQEVQEDF